MAFITIKEARERYGTTVVDNASWIVLEGGQVPTGNENVSSVAPGPEGIRIVRGAHPPACVLEDVEARAAALSVEEISYATFKQLWSDLKRRSG